MAKKIYLIRHGETNANLNHIWRGVTMDQPINGTGIAQAYALAEKLENLQLQVFYSSPLQRALMTAQICSGCLGNIPIILQNNLHEIDYGIAEGKPFAEVQKRWPEVYKAFIDPEPKLYHLGFPDGETNHQCISRIYQALTDITKSNFQSIGVVVHAGVMCSFMSSLGIRNPRTANCAVLPIIYDGNFHLDGELF